MEDLYTPREAAEILRVDEITLARWRGQGSGPEWIKLGSGRTSPVRYPKAALEAYLAQARP